jgi:crossover junction endodeoxyribonuclease RuvC
MTVILAIDPGITGAIAVYQPDRNVLDVYDMPLLDGDVDPHRLTAIVYASEATLAVLEKVHPMPKEGVSGVWRFSAAYTTARVVVMLCQIPLTLVSPAMWKSRMGLKGGKEGKEQARNQAILTFPDSAPQLNRKKDHGRAEAALLAVYASRTLIHRNPTQ